MKHQNILVIHISMVSQTGILFSIQLKAFNTAIEILTNHKQKNATKLILIGQLATKL